MATGKDGNDTVVEVSNRRLACSNTKFFVYFEHVRDGTGHEVPDYLVVAPRCAVKNLVTGAGVLPIVKGKLGMIRIYRPAIEGYSWEIPQGFIDEGEDDDAAAAMRELQEETGLVAAPGAFTSLGYVTPDAGVLAARVHLFVAESCRMASSSDGELGLRDFCFFSFEELDAMIGGGEIQDAATMAALYKYRLLLQARQSEAEAPGT